MTAYETIRAVTRLSTFLVFLLATALLGFFYNSRMLLALFEAGTIYLLGSYLYVRWASNRVSVTRELTLRAYEEDVLPITLALRNTGLLPLYLVQVQDWCPLEAVPGKTLLVPEVPGRGKVLRVKYNAKCDRGRGRFTIGPIRATVQDPLGLFHRTRVFAELSELVVYPKTFAIRDLGIRGLQSTSLVSTASPLRVGQTPLFYGTREYQAGDNPRRIHWRASARWGKLILQEYESPSNVELTCFLDLDRSTMCGLGRGSTIERAISIAASAAEFAESSGNPFQLIADGEEPLFLPPRVGRRSLLTVLDALARVKAGRTPYADLLRRGARFVADGSAVLLFLNKVDFDRDAVFEVSSIWMRKGVRGIAVVIDESTFTPIEQMHGPRDPSRVIDALRFLQGIGYTTFTIRSQDELEEVFSGAAIPEAEEVAG